MRPQKRLTVETDYGLGSGFVARQDGRATYLVTARHVVKGNSQLERGERPQGRLSAGTIEALDPKNDLALIRINGRPAGALAVPIDRVCAKLRRCQRPAGRRVSFEQGLTLIVPRL